VPGDDGETGGELSTAERARLTIPEAFRARVAAIIEPGTTVVVTPDSLTAGDTGAKLTVLTTG